MDISYCDDKTGFPRPGHIFSMAILQQNRSKSDHIIKLAKEIVN